MGLQTQLIDTNTAGIQLDLGTLDDALVATGITVSSTDDVAIVGTGTHSVIVNGTVTGAEGAITLGNDPALDESQYLNVGTTGSIYGFGIYAVTINGGYSTVENRGFIWSNSTGISINGVDGLYSGAS